MKNNPEYTISTHELVTGYGNGRNFVAAPKFAVNLHAKPGELIAIIGTNGSGKTTLLKTLAGLHPYKSGEIQICGHSPEKLSRIEFAKYLSIGTTEPIRMAYTSIFDFVSLGRFPYTNLFGKLTSSDIKIIQQAITETGLQDLQNKMMNHLSDGERQRAVIARTLAQDTSVILFDEPTGYLDIPNKFEILKMLKSLTVNLYKTILFSTHDLTAALNLADKIWLISSDKLIQKIPEQLVLDGDLSHEFNTQNIRFDDETFNFVFHEKTINQIGIEGEGLIFEITSKAMNRIGYKVSSNKSEPLNVIIETKENSVNWKLINGSSTTIFNQLEDLILHLKNINP